MERDKQNISDEKPTTDAAEQTTESTPEGEGEFKLTVRKLEMPVRPRGVLAE
jgi:hypothetical protein